MSLETITLEHVPPTYRVYATLFRDVQNASFLHSQLLARNADFEYAFVDATALISRLHLVAAIFRAITSHQACTLKTPNVHSEVVLSMSASNNIAESYKKFGISPTTSSVAIVKIVFPAADSSSSNPSCSHAPPRHSPLPPSADQIWQHLCKQVEGTAVPLTDENIAAVTDWAKIDKVYKISSASLSGIDVGRKKIQEKQVLALGAMALRGT